MRTSDFSSISSALATNEYLGVRRCSRITVFASDKMPHSLMVRRFSPLSVKNPLNHLETSDVCRNGNIALAPILAASDPFRDPQSRADQSQHHLKPCDRF